MVLTRICIVVCIVVSLTGCSYSMDGLSTALTKSTEVELIPKKVKTIFKFQDRLKSSKLELNKTTPKKDVVLR